MKTRLMLALAAVAVGLAFASSEAQAQPRIVTPNVYRSWQYPWHGGFYHTQWGQPVAQIVPPTACLQTKWGWGVTNTEIARIPHQFGRAWPGPYGGPYGGVYGFLGTPNWPSHTDQFGVYYVRGPW